MARAWIVDLWVKDAEMIAADGSTVKTSASAAQLKSISKLPEAYRTARFGRGKRWKLAWYETVGGVKRQRSKLFDSKRDAEELRASLEEDIRVGRYLQPENADRLVRDVAKLWLRSKRRVKASTAFNYSKIVNAYVLPQWGDWKLGRIDRESVEKWVTALQEGKAPVAFDEKYSKDPRPLGPSALKNVVRTVFGSILTFAIRENWIADNPVRFVELPKVPRTPVRETLTHAQVDAMAGAAEAITGERRDYVAVQMLTYSAPRINELFALQKRHLRFDAFEVEIEQTWSRAPAGGRQLGSPKNGDSRVVPMPEHIADELKALVKDLPDSAYVFRSTGSQEAMWDRNWHNRVWTPAATTAKLSGLFSKFSPHVLRHTGITFAIAAGADIKVIQAMAGHRSVEETMGTYGKLLPNRMNEVRKRMAEHRAAELRPRLKVVGGTRLGHDGNQ